MKKFMAWCVTAVFVVVGLLPVMAHADTMPSTSSPNGDDMCILPMLNGGTRTIRHDQLPNIYIPFRSDLKYYCPQSGGTGTVTFSRSGSATYWDSAGTRQTAGSQVARFGYIYYDGAWVGPWLVREPAATNHVLNSAAPATQTTGSLGTGIYTLWVEGSGSCAVAAGTATITGAGTASSGTPVVFSVTVSGTVVLTVSGSPTLFQLENKPCPTSYIATTAAPATRNADSVSITPANNVNVTTGTFLASVFLEASVPVASGTGSIHFIQFTGGTTTDAFYRNINLEPIRNHDSTSTLSLSGNTWVVKPYKVALTWGGAVRAIYNITDGLSTSGSFDGNLSTGTTLNLGYTGDMAGHYERDIYIFNRALSAAEVVTW